MAEHEHDALYKWMALLVCVIGTFMSILDSSIVNIAVPKLMAVFGVSLDDVKWILTAYTLALGAIIPLTGYLGDILGVDIYIGAVVAFSIRLFQNLSMIRGAIFERFRWRNVDNSHSKDV